MTERRTAGGNSERLLAGRRADVLLMRLREIPGFMPGPTLGEVDQVFGEFEALWAKAGPAQRAAYQSYVHFSMVDALQVLMLLEHQMVAQPLCSASDAVAAAREAYEERQRRRAAR